MRQFIKENFARINLKNPLFLVVIVLGILFLSFYYFYSGGEKNDQNVGKKTNVKNNLNQEIKVVSGDSKKDSNQRPLVVRDQKENSSEKIRVLTNEEAKGPSEGQIQSQLQLGTPDLQGKNIPELQQMEKK